MKRDRVLAAVGLVVWFASSWVAAYPRALAAEDAQVPVQVKRVVVVNETPAVLLLDPAEEQFLLVFVDFFMANAIQMGLEGPKLERPLTHDLIGIFLRTLGAKVTRVDITELKNNTYYALITLQVNGSSRQIDSRPSDALAIAVRNAVPVFVNPALLKPLKEQLSPAGPEEKAPPPKKSRPRIRT